MRKFVGRLVTGSVVAAALVFSLGLPSAASAQARGGAQRLRGMQHRETRAIGQAVRNGTLSRDQAKNLENHMSQLQASIAADKANGKLTRQEATALKNETKKIEKAINGAQYPKSTTAPPTH